MVESLEDRIVEALQKQPNTRYGLDNKLCTNTQVALQHLTFRGIITFEDVPTPRGTRGRNRYGYKRVYRVKYEVRFTVHKWPPS